MVRFATASLHACSVARVRPPLIAGLALLVLLGMLDGAAASEAPAEKTLAECVAFAIANQPSLKAARATVTAGARRVWQAAANYLPQVGADYSANRRMTSSTATTGADISTQSQTFNFFSSGFTLSQVLFDFGQTLNRIQAAQATEDSLVADLVTQRETVIFNVKQAYFNVLAARRLLRVAEDTVRQSEKHLEQAQGRFDVGFAPKFDVTQSRVQLARAQLNQVAARNNLRVAWATLGNALGLEGPPDFTIADRVDAPAIDIDEASALQRAYEHRPELLSLQAQQQALELQIAARQKDYLPNVAGSATYYWAGTNHPLTDNWNVGAAVNISLFNGGLTTAQIGEAKAGLANLRFNTEVERQNIALQVRQSVLALREAAESIVVAERGLEEARENLTLAEGRYATGAGSIIELTDAQASLTGAEASYVQARYNYMIAVASLERAMAQSLTPEIPS
jgi:outer membrane protein